MSDLFHPLLNLSNVNVICCDIGTMSSRRCSIPGTCDRYIWEISSESASVCFQHSADLGENKGRRNLSHEFPTNPDKRDQGHHVPAKIDSPENHCGSWHPMVSDLSSRCFICGQLWRCPMVGSQSPVLSRVPGNLTG